MRLSFFVAVIAANFIATAQASSFVQHQPVLFEEPANYFAQVSGEKKGDQKEETAKKDGTKDIKRSDNEEAEI